MKVFCDTSVLVAAVDAHHIHHGPSLRIVRALSSREGNCSLHSIAECYSTLTGAPRSGGRFPPSVVLSTLRDLLKVFTPQALTAVEHLKVVEECAGRGLTGGIIYDALIFECAQKVGADVLFTWNVDDFRRVATPEWVRRIQAP
ncbi:MAG: PIN domain-containing protein [Gemmatimonadaceae bacterium]|nr:PIN domain-containing protein [Gemmatimonadaceae bacterium]